MSDFIGAAIGAAMSPITNAWAGNAAQHAMDFTASQQLVAQDFNSAQAAETRDFNSREAEKTRQFQTEMSNTQYQRATKDMLTAGLNPMLAYSQGGAGTPVGATASGPTAASSGGSGTSFNVTNPALSAVAGAQVENMLKQNENIAADTKVKEKTADEIAARTPTYAVSMDAMRAQIEQTSQNIRESLSRISVNVASAAQAEQQTRNLQALLPQIAATIQQIKTQTKATEAQTGLTHAEHDAVVQRYMANLPELEAKYLAAKEFIERMHGPAAMTQAGMYSTPIGALNDLLHSFIPFIGSGQDVKR